MENFNQVCSLFLFVENIKLLFYLLEKLFDIARRVPFLAMTILEKNGPDNPWLFRTQPLKSGPTESMREVPLRLAPIPPPASLINQQQQQQRHHHQKQQQPQPPMSSSTIYIPPHQQQQQRLQQIENLRSRLPPVPNAIDPKKVVKSSTAPNLPTVHSHSEMFRVI